MHFQNTAIRHLKILKHKILRPNNICSSANNFMPSSLKHFIFVLFVISAIIFPLRAFPLRAQAAYVPPQPAPAASPVAPSPPPSGQAPDNALAKISDLINAGNYAEAQQSATTLLTLYPYDQRLIKAKTQLDNLLAAAKPADSVANDNPTANSVYTLLPPTPSASSTKTNPAPDAAVKNLSDLVHAGKFAEAQQSLAALLMLYPADQRLIKAQAVLDKASGKPDAESFTGTDKIDYDALIELAKEAQQNPNPEQQNALLKQFMDRSSPFLKKHPDEMLLWQIRAASALGLNDPDAGYEAGQKLLAANAAGGHDPNLQQLLAKLKLKGWLGKDKVAAEQKRISDPAVEKLCESLAQDNPGKVIDALKKLRKMKATEAAPRVLRCLTHSNPDVVREACRTLVVIGNQDAVPAIIPLLTHERPDIIREACRTLAIIGNKDVIPTIEPLLTNSRSDIREEAYKAITKLSTGGHAKKG
jgi:hypothetical protein